MNITISAIIIILAIVAFAVLCIKGLGGIGGALIATALVSIVAIGGFTTNFFGTFLGGMTSMMGPFFLLFTFGSAFGAVLSATGASDRMGVTFVRILGQKNFIYVIMLITCLVGVTGAPPLAIVPFLCFGMLKSANLPRYIGLAAVTGATSISTTVLPGAMGVGNVTSSAILGTNVYAAPGLGLATGIFGLLLLCLYVNWLIKKARKDNIGYDGVGENQAGETRSKENIPSFFCSIFPVIFMLGFCFVAILGFKMPSLYATVFASTCGILLLIILNHKYMHKSPVAVVKSGLEGIQWNIVAAVAVCGFATVIKNTTAFEAMTAALTGASGIHPYILVVVGTALIAGMTVSCNTSPAIFMNTLGLKLVENGVSAQVIHRLSNVAAGTFDSLPHSGATLLGLAMFGYNYKEGYKYVAVTTIAIPVLYTIFATVVALIFY